MKCNTIGKALVFSFDGLESVIFDTGNASTQLHEQAAMHGFEQKIRDNAAIARKQKDGTVITVTEQMRRDAVVALVAQLNSDTWNTKMRTPTIDPYIMQLAEKRGIGYVEAQAWYRAKLMDELNEAE